MEPLTLLNEKVGEERIGPAGVGGWLLLLILRIWASAALRLFDGITATVALLGINNTPLVTGLVHGPLNAGVGALAAVSGLLLAIKNPIGPLFTRIFLVVEAGYYLAPLFTSPAAILSFSAIDAFHFWLRPASYLLSSIVCLAYLSRSRRVANTYFRKSRGREEKDFGLSRAETRIWQEIKSSRHEVAQAANTGSHESRGREEEEASSSTVHPRIWEQSNSGKHDVAQTTDTGSHESRGHGEEELSSSTIHPRIWDQSNSGRHGVAEVEEPTTPKAQFAETEEPATPKAQVTGTEELTTPTAQVAAEEELRTPEAQVTETEEPATPQARIAEEEELDALKAQVTEGVTQWLATAPNHPARRRRATRSGSQNGHASVPGETGGADNAETIDEKLLKQVRVICDHAWSVHVGLSATLPNTSDAGGSLEKELQKWAIAQAAWRLTRSLDIRAAMEANGPFENVIEDRNYLLVIVEKNASEDRLGTGAELAEYEGRSEPEMAYMLILQAQEDMFEAEMWAHVASLAGDTDFPARFADAGAKSFQESLQDWRARVSSMREERESVGPVATGDPQNGSHPANGARTQNPQRNLGRFAGV